MNLPVEVENESSSSSSDDYYCGTEDDYKEYMFFSYYYYVFRINNIVTSDVHLFIYISIISRYLRSEKIKNGNHYVQTTSVGPWPSISVCRIFMKFECNFFIVSFVKIVAVRSIHHFRVQINTHPLPIYFLTDMRKIWCRRYQRNVISQV